MIVATLVFFDHFLVITPPYIPWGERKEETERAIDVRRASNSRIG